MAVKDVTLLTVRVSSAKPSNMREMSEKKMTEKYRLPDSTESGCRLVRRNSVAVTTAISIVTKNLDAGPHNIRALMQDAKVQAATLDHY